MQKRALTINFQRSVTAGKPNELEVAVAPLSEPNAPPLDVTLAGLKDTRTILLANEINPVVFELVPTDHPDLTERLTYRIAWREKYMGRQFTKDFVMPDFDTDFDDLEDLGNIIGGETYLQWTDRSHPGGVAGLNDAGQVIDSEGNVVSGAESAAQVQGNLDNEVVARQQGDNQTRLIVLSQLNDQINQVYASTANQLNAAVAQLQNADTTEKAQRQAAVANLNAVLTALQTSVNTQVSDLEDLIDQYNDQFATKADLVSGKIPKSQLPDISLGKAVPVADQAAMLALTSTQVQPGDFAVRPDGVYFLNATPASQLSNWIQFTVAASVFSINGLTGAVVLSAEDVDARSVNTPVPLDDVAGLTAALAGKTSTGTTSALNTRVTNIENDATLVHKVSGLIPRADMPADVVFVNSSDLVTKKDGTVLNVGGGGTLDIEDVDGLEEALDSKLDSNHVSVTNARTPTAHKTSHATGGSDVLTPGDIGAATATHTHAQSDITGLVGDLDDHGDRIESLEGRVEDLELGGGGGGTGASGKTVWWSETGIIDPLNTATDDILLRSPFGYDGANYYYDPAGVDPSESVWPYLSPNGHLKFIARNESAPEDDALATQDALDLLSDVVDTKASQANLDALSSTVDLKATISALNALSGVVDTKAAITALNALADDVAGKADQSALDSLTTTVNTKATQSSLDSLTTTVGTKASSADLTALTSTVSGHTTNKANLVSGTVPLSELPNNIPASKITGLPDALTTKADLVSGTVPLSQLPSYPTSKVTGLEATLAAKADLVDGKVPSTQLPNLAFSATYPVANRAAMLALTTIQVQPGDVAVITGTADKGSYILNATDPSAFENWVKLVAPDDTVQSVNSKTGTVVLNAADVGARSSSVSIPQADVTNLVSALASKVDTSTYTTGLATKTTPADVQTLMTDSVSFKQRADYVATSAIASTSGQQAVDGTLAPLGSIVLLTAQSSSVNNGLWQVNSGAWTRVTDMNTGAYFVRGTVVVITSGANHASTIWQQTNSSGVTGTNANNWSKILTAGAPPVYTASLGVSRVGNDFRAVVVNGGGVQVVSGGLQLDPNVAVRKVAMDVPAGSAIVTLTHNLNTTDVAASFRAKTSGDAVLVGWKPTGVNTISVEFKTAPTTGQWRAVIMG